jgi:hypothetical protein
MRWMVLFFGALFGCGAEQVGEEPTQLVEAAVARYFDGSLDPLTDEPRASVAVPGAQVQLWTRPEDAASYADIDIDGSGSGARLLEGAVVVREVLDEARVLTKLTLVVKGPNEANPALGGWLFGAFSPDGELLVDDNGEPLLGAVAACGACHLARSGDDFLFGVP